MMQTLTKTELAWIYDALLHKVTHCNLDMQNATDDLTYGVAELMRDNLRSVMHKLHEAMNDGSKRIAIK